MPFFRPKKKKQKQIEVAHRRIGVVDMYIKGHDRRHIAQTLGISMNAVNRDIRSLHKYWKAISLATYEEKMLLELNRIDHLEQECWHAWQRSQQDEEQHFRKVEGFEYNGDTPIDDELDDTEYIMNDDDEDHDAPPRPRNRSTNRKASRLGKKIIEQTTRRGQTGNAAFLRQIAWCIEARCKLLGLLNEVKPINQIVLDWDGLARRLASQQTQSNGIGYDPTLSRPPHTGEVIEVEAELIRTEQVETVEEKLARMLEEASQKNGLSEPTPTEQTNGESRSTG